MDLGRRIQEFRRGKGLSQEGLAERMGVSRQAISKWESGAAVPEVDKLIQLARFFGVTMDELLGVRPPKGAAPPAPGENGEVPPPDPGPEERLRALEGMVAALMEERRRRGGERKWTMYLPLMVSVPVLVLSLCFSAYHASRTQRRLQDLRVELERLNYEVVDLKYKEDPVSVPAPGEGDAAGSLADWDISFLDYNLEERTVTCRLSATPKNLREGMTAEFILARRDGMASGLPAQAVAGAVFQAEAPIPWEGETTVSLSLLDGETGERTLYPLTVLHSPGDSLRLHDLALYEGTTAFPEGRVSFRGTVRWECWDHGRENGFPVKNYAVSARAAVYIDGEEIEAFPFELGDPEGRENPLALLLPLAKEYPLGPGQRLELVMEVTDALGQEYREVLAACAADGSGKIDAVE